MILPPAVVIHGLPHVQAALAAGRPVLLLSAPGAGCYAGAGWWQALMGNALDCPNALDCSDQAGRALEALAAGCRIVILHPCPGLPPVTARAAGALILNERPPALDLATPGAARHLAAWLRRDSAGTIG